MTFLPIATVIALTIGAILGGIAVFWWIRKERKRSTVRRPATPVPYPTTA